MIGTPLPRIEDQRLVRGLGRYTDDFFARFVARFEAPAQAYEAAPGSWWCRRTA
jgi:hypothetical protein